MGRGLGVISFIRRFIFKGQSHTTTPFLVLLNTLHIFV